MADITFTCPHCHQHIEADDSVCGQTVECPSCQRKILVPEISNQKSSVARITVVPSSDPDDQDEKTLFIKTPANRAYLGRMIGAGIWSIIAIAILLVIKFNPFVSIVLPPLLIGGITAMAIWIDTHSTEYRLTTQRLFLKKGLVAKHLDELELFRIKDVTVSQGIIQRILGFGSVTVLSTDDTTPKVILRGIPNPVETKELIRKTFRAARKNERVRATEFIPS